MSLVPAVCVIGLAIWTKRVLEPLIAGCLIGAIIIAKGLSGGKFFETLMGIAYDTLMGETTAWCILVLGLFGSFVALIEKSGGALGFQNGAAKVVKGEKSTLVVTWLLGIAIFADDYLNALGVGMAMRKLADKYLIAREYLAYVVNSTGAAVCVIIPVSTWAAFMASQLEESGVAAKGEGTSVYIQTIPYMFYAFAAVVIVPLFIFVIPKFGPMKKAIMRAKETKQTLPDSTYNEMKEADALKEPELKKKPNILNFAIPMIVLVAATIYFSDMLYGVIIAICVCIIMYLVQRLMKPAEMGDAVIKGFTDMVFPLMIVTVAFMLQAVNDKLGLTDFVINTVAPVLPAFALPVVSFIIVGILAFCTGSFWGVAAIAFPIIAPLAQDMGVNSLLACGAVISGAIFGSHTCFYSDAATLTCSATQIKNIDYAKTVLPLIVVPFVIGIVAFLIGGIVIK